MKKPRKIKPGKLELECNLCGTRIGCLEKWQDAAMAEHILNWHPFALLTTPLAVDVLRRAVSLAQAAANAVFGVK